MFVEASSLVEDNNVTENTLEQKANKKRKLPFGHFKVQIKKGSSNMDKFVFEGVEEVVCKPLTQEELGDGWVMNNPNSSRTQPIHHYSVTLAQLPANQWKKIDRDFQDGKETYKIIKSGNYYYSVNETNYDSEMRALYRELSMGYNANLDRVKMLLGKLPNQINGWLVFRAQQFLKGNRYFEDLSL